MFDLQWRVTIRRHSILTEMKADSQLVTQTIVFSLVGTAFTTVYITQPVLPVIENEFGITSISWAFSTVPWNSTAG